MRYLIAAALGVLAMTEGNAETCPSAEEYEGVDLELLRPETAPEHVTLSPALQAALLEFASHVSEELGEGEWVLIITCSLGSKIRNSNGTIVDEIGPRAIIGTDTRDALERAYQLKQGGRSMLFDLDGQPVLVLMNWPGRASEPLTLDFKDGRVTAPSRG
ncbi:MAG: hypothetical protein AAFV62_13015 [Pseudomonadota bacterium]